MQLSDETSVSYQYNPDGIRIGKTVNDTETSYFVDASGTMQAMKQGDEELVFLYDATGRREGFIWYHEGQKQGTYYYLYNVQSDVIGMVAEDMSPVVTYEYDAWGKLLSVSGEKKDTVGKLNPFRYRGYVYEEESGLYYVTSRYYDPEVGRFLNADGYVSTGQGLFGNNMFGYCENNPVNRFDPTGHFWSGVWNFIKTAVTEVGKAIGAISPVYAGCGGAAAIDGPLLIADAIALGIAAVCTIRAVSKGIYIAAKTPSISQSKAKEKTKVIPMKPPSPTTIYRYGGTNPGNLTPTKKDLSTGLSFSTKPPKNGGAAMTTIEALNATGIVYAVKDGATHVSVYPIGGTMKDWEAAGSSSIWTQAVKSVVVKWDGVIR